MKIITRKVYYCDHCKRHRLTAMAIETHEPKCIRNPGRSVCGWHPDRLPSPPYALVDEFQQNLDIGWLSDKVDGCPSCMVAVVVQAGLSREDSDDICFSYEQAVRDYREGEQQAERDAEIRALESGWL